MTNFGQKVHIKSKTYLGALLSFEFSLSDENVFDVVRLILVVVSDRQKGDVTKVLLY